MENPFLPPDWVPRPVPPLGFSTPATGIPFDAAKAPITQWGVGQAAPLNSYGPTAAQMDEVIKALNRIADILVRTV